MWSVRFAMRLTPSQNMGKERRVIQNSERNVMSGPDYVSLLRI
jgi:hypothetical protein